MKAQGSGARSFLSMARRLAVAKSTGARGRWRATLSKLQEKKEREDNSGKVDRRTLLAFTAALAKIDRSRRLDSFYDPSDEATCEAESPERALSILRSWMRRQGHQALPLFQSWDADNSMLIGQRELTNGLAGLGIVLSKEMSGRVFDFLAEGTRQRTGRAPQDCTSCASD